MHFHHCCYQEYHRVGWMGTKYHAFTRKRAVKLILRPINFNIIILNLYAYVMACSRHGFTFRLYLKKIVTSVPFHPIRHTVRWNGTKSLGTSRFPCSWPHLGVQLDMHSWTEHWLSNNLKNTHVPKWANVTLQTHLHTAGTRRWCHFNP